MYVRACLLTRVCVCARVCVWERERDRQTDRERERAPALPHTIIKRWHVLHSCKSSKALRLNDKFLNILK